MIPTENADMETLSVKVRPNESSTTTDSYNLVSNITEVKILIEFIFFLRQKMKNMK